jgi:hypothetical protein
LSEGGATLATPGTLDEKLTPRGTASIVQLLKVAV